MIYDAGTIGLRMKQLRKIRGLNQKTVADRLGVTAAYYCMIESGVRNIAVPQLMEFAELIEVPVDVVLGGCVEADPMQMELAPEEQEILNLFRSLNQNQKKQALKSMLDIREPEIIDKPRKRTPKKS